MKRLSLLTILVILILLLSLPAYAQQTNTIYQGTLVGETGSVEFYTPLVRSIGQISHQMVIRLGDNGGNTCNTPSFLNNADNRADVIMTLVGSYDNSNFFPIAQSLTVSVPEAVGASANNRYIILVNGYGSFPYVKLFVRSYNYVDCLIKQISYSGNIISQNFVSLTDTPVIATNSTFPIWFTVPTDTGGLCPNIYGLRMALMGGYLISNADMPAGVQILDINTADGSLPIAKTIVAPMKANVPVVFNVSGDQPVLITRYNSDLVLKYIDAGQISGYVICRGQ